MPISRQTRRFLTWGAILLAWTLIVLAVAAQAYVFAISRNRPDSFRREFLVASSEWYVWAALTPLVLFLCRRLRITARNWGVTVPVHLAAGIVVSLVQLAIQVKLNFILNPGYTMGFWKVLYFFATYKLHVNLLTYVVLVALNHGWYYYEQWRSRELAWARMQSELANAQLQALNMQLHPHFLFNTLNSISALIADDPAAAQDMVLKLSDLLRATLRKIERPEVTLREELELLDCYLGIEQIRFKDRLSIRKQVDDSALPCLVPTMILQPLVENAVRHGIGKHKQADEITIIARRGAEGSLLMEVRNRVGSTGNGAESPRGIGLSNTRARLEQLYANSHALAIANCDGGGVAVTFILPVNDANRTAAASKG
jgi:two-component system, LytTR family, sensor kinase